MTAMRMLGECGGIREGICIDIGCGPGNSTRVLWERWPRAAVTGLDSSAEMIAKAQAEYPNGAWRLGDAQELPSEPKFDLVYSNATIQWIPDHERLILHLLDLVSPFFDHSRCRRFHDSAP